MQHESLNHKAILKIKIANIHSSRFFTHTEISSDFIAISHICSVFFEYFIISESKFNIKHEHT